MYQSPDSNIQEVKLLSKSRKVAKKVVVKRDLLIKENGGDFRRPILSVLHLIFIFFCDIFLTFAAAIILVLIQKVDLAAQFTILQRQSL